MRIAVVGATGAVGREMLRILEERRFPSDDVVLLASERSAGTEIRFKGETLTVQAVAPEFAEAVVRGDVQGYAGITPFVRWRDTPVIVLALLLVAGVWLHRRRRSTG